MLSSSRLRIIFEMECPAVVGRFIDSLILCYNLALLEIMFMAGPVL